MEITRDEIRQTIIDECESIKQLLLEKNESYGNSVFQPLGIFAKSDPEEQICIRIDDKLKRLQRGKEYQGDDSVKDLVGYLHLLRIWRRLRDTKPAKPAYDPASVLFDPSNVAGRPMSPQSDHWKEKEVK